MITLHAGALLTTVRLGGQLGDRWSRRLTLLLGLSIQVSVMVYFALLPAGLPPWTAAIGLLVHGMAAGLSLAVLHQVAMDHIPQAQSGEAAGLYSMTRFGGNILGTTLGGVVLQQALGRAAMPIGAYQISFAFIALVGFTGIFVAGRIRE
ncbi:MAG: MFS transporter [Caldilineaceae bacterium]|nr:MFS transporter [Caldilineaceae bacterium]